MNNLVRVFSFITLLTAALSGCGGSSNGGSQAAARAAAARTEPSTSGMRVNMTVSPLGVKVEYPTERRAARRRRL